MIETVKLALTVTIDGRMMNRTRTRTPDNLIDIFGDTDMKPVILLFKLQVSNGLVNLDIAK